MRQVTDESMWCSNRRDVAFMIYIHEASFESSNMLNSSTLDRQVK